MGGSGVQVRLRQRGLTDQPPALAVWIRDRERGTYAGELTVHFDPDMPAAERQRRIDAFYSALARDHPEQEAIPMNEPRPPDPLAADLGEPQPPAA